MSERMAEHVPDARTNMSEWMPDRNAGKNVRIYAGQNAGMTVGIYARKTARKIAEYMLETCFRLICQGGDHLKDLEGVIQNIMCH